MGISFHYRGKIKNVVQIPELIDESKQFAEESHWKFEIIDDLEVRGIVLSPDKCEPVWLCFDVNGVARSYDNQGRHSDARQSFIHIKTHYAGPEIHKALITLLDF